MDWLHDRFRGKEARFSWDVTEYKALEFALKTILEVYEP